MNSKYRKAITSCAILLGSISGHQVVSQQPFPRDRTKAVPTLLPDTATRQKVRSIRAAQVVKMSFFGPSLGRWENNPLDIRDSRLVRRFLEALNHAKSPYLGTADRADTLLIYTKSLKKGDYPLRFDYNPKSPASCYGVEFYNIVKKLNDKHQVRHIKSDS